MVEATADRIEEDPDVREAEVESTERGPVVVARVYNEHCGRRLRSSLHEYPAYVRVEVDA